LTRIRNGSGVIGCNLHRVDFTPTVYS
jgi:hypothetical protein